MFITMYHFPCRELNTSSAQVQEYPDVFQCLNVHVIHGYDSCSHYKLSINMRKSQWFCLDEISIQQVCISEYDALSSVGYEWWTWCFKWDRFEHLSARILVEQLRWRWLRVSLLQRETIGKWITWLLFLPCTLSFLAITIQWYGWKISGTSPPSYYLMPRSREVCYGLILFQLLSVLGTNFKHLNLNHLSILFLFCNDLMSLSKYKWLRFMTKIWYHLNVIQARIFVEMFTTTSTFIVNRHYSVPIIINSTTHYP